MALPSMTLLELRTVVRQRADITNNEVVTDSELNGYINNSLYELYDLLITCYGENYYATSYNFTTDGTNESYALPSAFYKGLGLDLQVSNDANGWLTLRAYNFGERNRYSLPNTRLAYGLRGNLRYDFVANNVRLTPLPSAGQVIRLWYIPQMTALTSDSDSTNGISGWLEYVIVDAAIKCKDKQDLDVKVMMAQKQGLIQRINTTAPNRDVGDPQTVRDVYRTGGYGFLGADDFYGDF